MIVVDTSVWIEYFRNPDQSTGRKLINHIDQGEVVVLSAVFGELLQGVRDEREQKLVLEFWNDLTKVNESILFIEAGKLSYQNKLFSKGMGLIDCYILAAVRLFNLDLFTLDKKLRATFEILKK